MENDFNDTLGAGSYPTPEDSKEKGYRFKCLCEVEINCWGKNKEDAEQYCNLQDYADLRITTIEDIIDWSIIE